jgi:hypothetical protein
MSAIVDYNIQLWNLVFYSSPETPIGLVAYENVYAIVFVGFALGLDVNAVDMAMVPEVAPPHIQTSATVNPDLQDLNMCVSKFAEVPLVDIEVMIPFPDTAALSSLFEEGAESIRRHGGRLLGRIAHWPCYISRPSRVLVSGVRSSPELLDLAYLVNGTRRQHPLD